MAQHLFGDVEIGDHAVFERPDGADGTGRAAEHALGFGTHRVDLARTVVDSDDGRLGEHDPAAADIDECVGGTEVDGDVARAEASEEVEETDDLLLSIRFSPPYYTPSLCGATRLSRRNPYATTRGGGTGSHENGATPKRASPSRASATGSPTTFQ
jgi:hypothetical protein